MVDKEPVSQGARGRGDNLDDAEDEKEGAEFDVKEEHGEDKVHDEEREVVNEEVKEEEGIAVDVEGLQLDIKAEVLDSALWLSQYEDGDGKVEAGGMELQRERLEALAEEQLGVGAFEGVCEL